MNFQEIQAFINEVDTVVVMAEVVVVDPVVVEVVHEDHVVVVMEVTGMGDLIVAVVVVAAVAVLETIVEINGVEVVVVVWEEVMAINHFLRITLEELPVVVALVIVKMVVHMEEVVVGAVTDNRMVINIDIVYSRIKFYLCNIISKKNKKRTTLSNIADNIFHTRFSL